MHRGCVVMRPQLSKDSGNLTPVVMPRHKHPCHAAASRSNKALGLNGVPSFSALSVVGLMMVRSGHPVNRMKLFRWFLGSSKPLTALHQMSGGETAEPCMHHI